MKARHPGRSLEVFSAFLKLGLTSFGGPIAHLGYFRHEFVERRRWIDDAGYAQLVALCQFLPGPASSQLGFALGLIRAGWLGGVAAFVAFTLPSALLLVAFSQLLHELQTPMGLAVIHGMKLLAVAVVAQGLVGMARTLTPDAPRRLIAAAVAASIVISGTALTQWLVVAAGALLGLVFCRNVALATGVVPSLSHGRRGGALLLIIFALFLVAAFVPSIATSPLAAVTAAFYRAGALVFGGGHVVLPLLEQAVVAPGWVSQDDFLAGYGAAQAVPGPMFSLAAFLGARVDTGTGPVIGAAVSTIAIFLPGLLLVAGTLPFWRELGKSTAALSAIAGLNAAVVGLLAAALYDPVWLSAIAAPADFAIALIAFALLASARVSVLAVLAWCALASVARAWSGL